MFGHSVGALEPLDLRCSAAPSNETRHADRHADRDADETPPPTATETATPATESATADGDRHADARPPPPPHAPPADAAATATPHRPRPRPTADALVAKDRIPTSRIARTARVSSLAAGPGRAPPRHARDQPRPLRGGQEAALERRHLEAAEQIVTALGTMKGAAMKLGQVMSFLDVGLVPEEHREEFQRKLGALRDAAPKVRFADMRKVIESELDGAAARAPSPSSTPSRSPPPRSARSTARGCTTGATSRSRSSTRASPPPCGPTCRTSGSSCG